MPDDCATIKAKLDSAIDAYTRLTQGGAVRVIQDTDGSRVEYTAANAARLYANIGLLQAQYNACIAGRPAVVTRPVNFIF